MRGRFTGSRRAGTDSVSSPNRRVTTGAPDWGPPWIGPIHHRDQIDLLWLLAALLMLASGLVFFGWRALLGVCTTSLATLLTYGVGSAVFKQIKPNVMLDSHLHALVLGLFMGLTLPAQCSGQTAFVAGLLAGLAAHVVGRSHRVRCHPVAVVILAGGLWGTYGHVHGPFQEIARYQSAGAVLRPERVVVGDLCQITEGLDHRPWLTARAPAAGDALARVEPITLLTTYRRDMLRDRSMLAGVLGTGRVVPLTDLVLGAVPGPAGGTSRVLLIAIGLYLMYRRLAWWPMALAALVACLTTLLVMPVTHENQGTLVALRLAGMGKTATITYLAYEILASPLALVLMILAPQTAPVSASGKLIYGTIIGCGMILAQWFLAPPFAPFVGLFVAGLLSRPLDALHQGPFLKQHRKIAD